MIVTKTATRNAGDLGLGIRKLWLERAWYREYILD